MRYLVKVTARQRLDVLDVKWLVVGLPGRRQSKHGGRQEDEADEHDHQYRAWCGGAP